MKNYSTEYFKNTLQYKSYIKAFNEIKEMTNNSGEEVKLQDIDLEEVYFLCYVGEIIDSMCKAMNPDLLMDEEFANILSLIIDNVTESFCIDVSTILHFGLLYYNSHLFDEVELQYWNKRMNSLFDGFSSNVVSFKDFYEEYFSNQFVGGDDPQIKSFLEYMEYTYVFYIETDYQDANMYGPDYMSHFVLFAQEYTAFYRDLSYSIKKLKEGKTA